jgi:DNA-binding PadR family transcriptional regulator
MSTRSGTEHTLRPRVIGAALRLETFTAQEIVAEGQLDNTKQAYNQLKDLEKAGLIIASRLPADRAYRPKNLYEVPAAKRSELAAEIAKYGVRTISEVSPVIENVVRDQALNRAATRGRALVDNLEERLSRLRPADVKREEIEGVLSTLRNIEKDLKEVEIDLETAKRASRDFPEDTRAVLLDFRLREIKILLTRQQNDIRKRRIELSVRTLVDQWVDSIPNPLEWAREVLQPNEGKLGAELVLDMLSLGLHKKDRMTAVIASHAMRTNKLDLIRTCLNKFAGGESLWWRYNQLNADFMTGHHEEVYKRWHDVYADLKRARTTLERDAAAIGVYTYNPKNLKQAKLLLLLRKYEEVSIVSPHALPIWDLSQEIVRPLLVDPASIAGNDYGPLIHTVALCPEEGPSPTWELYAYGPLTLMIGGWPGAPALRVAASIDGLTGMNVDVLKIAEALRHEKGVVVLEQSNVHNPEMFRKDAEKVFGSIEMIGSALSAPPAVSVQNVLR